MNYKTCVLTAATVLFMFLSVRQGSAFESYQPQGFIQNRGQYDSEILYVLPRGSAAVMFTKDAAVFSVPGTESTEVCSMNYQNTTTENISGMNLMAAYCNYYIAGSSYEKVNVFEKVIYKNIYPKIDLIYYLNSDNLLEYDFIVHPGGTVGDIKCMLKSDKMPELNDRGELLIYAGDSRIITQSPVSYFAETLQPQTSAFLLEGSQLSYSCAAESGGNTLVIDPIIRIESTYFGYYDDERGKAVDTDDSSNVYLSGNAILSIPKIEDNRLLDSELQDAFVCKYDDSGNLIWTTVFGGTASEETRDMKVNSSGFAYVCGKTESDDFAADTEQTEYGGNGDGFAFCLNPDGTVAWAEYIGGSGSDAASAIVLDRLSNVFIAGETQSPDFQSTVQTYKAPYQDVFVMMLDADGSGRWATLFGGDSTDIATDIDLSSGSDIFVTGYTMSSDLSVIEDSELSGNTDAFLARFNSQGWLRWARYYGGNGVDKANAVTADSRNNAYIAGITSSSDLDAVGSFQSLKAFGNDAFAASFDKDAAFTWATYCGGNGNDEANDIMFDVSGNIIIAGTSSSTDMSMLSPQATNAGENDAFLKILTLSGAGGWGTYFGGSGNDYARALAKNSKGDIYLAGYTSSADMPADGEQTVFGGTYDAFLAAFGDDSQDEIVIENIMGEPFCTGDNLAVPYVVITTMNSGNVFTAQLSDEFGSFDKPRNIGTRASQTSGTINCVLPDDLAVGSGYRVRVVSSSPKITGMDNNFDLRISAFCDMGASITGIIGGSAAWGDYNNDDYMDILITGRYDTNTRITKIYRYNGDSTFTDQSYSIIRLMNSRAAWADYNNDGYLDFALCGMDDEDSYTYIFKNQKNGTFVPIEQFFEGVAQGHVSWIDYDNDGYLDLFYTGLDGSNYISKLYKNIGNEYFKDMRTALPGFIKGTADWADYDNDGDPDLIICGSNDNGAFTQLYRNDGGSFTPISTGFPDLDASWACWGDYDADGDPDIFLLGLDGSTPVSRIYNNDLGTFRDIEAAELIGVSDGSADWGDYDNDGDPDLIVIGWNIDFEQTTYFYRNDGNGNFVRIDPGFIPITQGAVEFGDFDNDNDIDLLYAGYRGEQEKIAMVYRNNGTSFNTPPLYPTNLSSLPVCDSVQLGWEKSSDYETADAGLTYNIRLGLINDNISRRTAMADTVYGTRRIAARGNSDAANTLTIKDLVSGTYIWSVQAVDNSYSGSIFPYRDQFKINTISTTIEQSEFCGGDNLTVYFDACRSYDSRSKFVAQLSDVFGKFDNPVDIGELEAYLSGAYEIEARIPKDVKDGSLYKIRVIATYPMDFAFDNGNALVINALPEMRLLEGSDSVCSNTVEYYTSTTEVSTTHLWRVEGGEIIGDSTSNIADVLWGDGPSGKLFYTQKNLNTGCADTLHLDVTIQALPEVNITGPATVLNNTSHLYSTTPDPSSDILWTAMGGTVAEPANIADVTVNWGSSGSGYITLIKTHKLSQCADTLVYAVTITDSLALSIFGEFDVCTGDTVLYTTIDDESLISWEADFGEIISTEEAACKVFWGEQGIGSVTLYKENAQTAQTDSLRRFVNIYETPEKPTITRDSNLLISSSPDGNQWYEYDALIPGATDQHYAPARNSSYYVEVTNEYDCTSERSDGFFFETSIPELTIGDNISVYPNPFGSSFNLQMDFSSGGNIEIRLINLLGETVFEDKAAFSEGLFLRSYSADTLAEGIYLLRININGSFYFTKVTKY